MVHSISIKHCIKEKLQSSAMRSEPVGTNTANMQTPEASHAYILEQRKILRYYFVDLIEVVAASKAYIDFDGMLRNLGLSQTRISSGADQLSFEIYYRLLGAIHETQKIPGLGLLLGQKKSLQNFGIYGYAILSSTTFAQFALVARRIFRALYDVLELSVRTEGGQVIFGYETLLPAKVGYVPLMEQVLSTGVVLIGKLMPSTLNWSECEARFTFPKPKYLKMYEDCFSCRFRFNQERTELRVPERWMNIPISSGDEVMSDVCERQFKRMLDDLNPAESMADKVRRMLVYSPSNRVPKLTEVAAKCHVAERTLRHHLAVEGVSFRDLVNDVRVSLAKRYLKDTDLSAQEVAYLLGYSQTQNFYRAFGKIAGVTPEAFRKACKNPA